MGGILRRDSADSSTPSQESREFTRDQVRKNTEINATLGAEGIELRERLHTGSPASDSPAKHYPKTKAPSALRKGELDEDDGFADGRHDIGFDEQGIRDWDQHRGQTQKILEPNTPYMGTAADTEYYDDDPVPEDLDLGGAA